MPIQQRESARHIAEVVTCFAQLKHICDGTVRRIQRDEVAYRFKIGFCVVG